MIYIKKSGRAGSTYAPGAHAQNNVATYPLALPNVDQILQGLDTRRTYSCCFQASCPEEATWLLAVVLKFNHRHYIFAAITLVYLEDRVQHIMQANRSQMLQLCQYLSFFYGIMRVPSSTVYNKSVEVKPLSRFQIDFLTIVETYRHCLKQQNLHKFMKCNKHTWEQLKCLGISLVTQRLNQT